MQYGLKILRGKLNQELANREEYLEHAQSEDEETRAWAERNLSSVDNRIEDLEITINYIKIEVDKVREEKRQAQMEASKTNKKKQNSS